MVVFLGVAGFDGHADKVGDVGGLHFGHEVGAVVVDGSGGDSEFVGNHLGGLAFNYGGEQFGFARAKGFEFFAHDIPGRAVRQASAVGGEGAVYNGHEHRALERLFEKIQSAKFQ